MALSTTQKAFRSPGARALTGILLRPTNPLRDGAEELIAVSDGPLWTSDQGTVRNVTFGAFLDESGNTTISESLTSPGQLTGEGEYTASRIVINADDYLASIWRDLLWNGNPIEVYFGAERRADGQPMRFEDFDPAFIGIMDEAMPGGRKQLEVTFADLRLQYDQPMEPKVYRGFGGGLVISGSASVGVQLSQAHDAAMDVNGALTIVAVGSLEQLRVPTPATALTPLFMNGSNNVGGDVAVNHALMIDDATGQLAFAGGLDGGGVSEVLLSGYVIPVGPFVLGATVQGDGITVTFFGGSDGSDLAEVGSGTLSFPIAAGPTDGFKVGQDGGSDFTLWELWVRNVAKSLEELVAKVDGPTLDAATDASLLDVLRFEEGTEIGVGPERIFGEKGILRMIPQGPGSLSWVSTYSGDAPDLFPGSVAGKRRSQVHGPVNNVELVQLDSQRHVYGWDYVPGADVSRVRQAGTPMVPQLAVTGVGAGDLVFDGAGRTVRINNPAIGSFSKFIPGQVSPARLGQRVKISSTVLNNGIYRLARAGVSLDGLTMTLADKKVTSESAPIGAKIETHEPDGQYTLELPRSAVVLRGRPSGALTADLVGRLPPSGFARWSELVEAATGEAPDTSAVVFDPILGYVLKPDDSLSTNNVLTELNKSAFGWSVLSGVTGWRIGNFVPPSGPEVESIGTEQLLAVESLDSLKPFWRFSVGHSKMWKTQSGDDLVGSVSAADRLRFGQEYTYLNSATRSVLSSYPTATEHPGFTTWIANAGDAEIFRQLAEAMISAKRYWYRLRFSGLWALSIQINDVVRVTYDDPVMQLVGTPLRIVTKEIDLSSYTMLLEGYT